MRLACLLGLLLAAYPALSGSLSGIPLDSPFNPQSNPKYQFRCDEARITVLTNKLVRVEQVPAGKFEDRASLLVIDRQTAPAAEVTYNTTADWCNVTIKPTDPGITDYINHIGYKRQAPQSSPLNCSQAIPDADVQCVSRPCARSKAYPTGATVGNQSACCALCNAQPDCGSWVYHTADKGANCYLLKPGAVTGTEPSPGHVVGMTQPKNSTQLLAGHLVVSGVAQFGPWVYHAGDYDPHNLLGTIKRAPSVDLQGCCNNSAGWDDRYPLQPGILSSQGWAVLDDIPNRLLSDEGWIVPASEGRVVNSADLYVFGCGWNYTGCLKDLTLVAGRVSMPPLNALGIWWSRHWGDGFDGNPFGPMSETNIKNEVVEQYRQRDIPLHVVVMDMEWHTMLQAPECTTFIGKKGWGGYTWNSSLFPDVQEFVDYLHRDNIKLSINYHPDNGIDACQTAYETMAKVLGVDPSSKATLKDFNQASENATYSEAYFQNVIQPTLVDYSWPDSPQVSTWTSILWDADMTRRNLRPLTLSRYGGPGSHRAPIGFSGDTLRKWDTLAYEVYMTPRASNVLFGYWSHDIGGFSGAEVDSSHHTESPELFLRWLQFATFAPIFRTHCRYCEQRIWTFGPDWYPLMKATMVLRNMLVPYIYTQARYAFDEGLCLLRPMYYAAPSSPQSYDPEFDTQYQFGSDILVAPIVTSSSTPKDKSVFLPPSDVWLEMATGLTYPSSNVVTVPPRLNQTVWFVRVGSMIPLRTYGDTHSSMTQFAYWMIPPAARGSGTLYEDDGTSMNHTIEKSFARTTASFHTAGANVTINVATKLPSIPFAGMQPRRSYTFQLLLETEDPQLATCNGAAASATRVVQGLAVNPGAGPDVTALEVTCNDVDVGQPLEVFVMRN
eukprot:m.232749 g.232749  ORF g.232749 m.232749 type:complete len:892 (+) comp17374_c0_seq25:3801-6476(+)